MQAIDELGTSADKLGVTSEALSALQFAATQSDTSIETLQGGLQKLNQKLGDATTGGKASAEAFKELGLDAASLSQMGATEAFEQIASKISGISDPAQQAAAAVSIFGKSGAELLPLLKQGDAGIEKLKARAKELGLVMNDTDVQKVKQANDAIDEMKSAFTGVFNIVAVELAPIITHFTTQLTESGYLGQDAASWILTGLEWVVTGVGYCIDAFNTFMGVWYTIKFVVGGIITGIVGLFTGAVMMIVGSINWLLESIGMSRIGDTFVGVMQDFTKALAQETGKALGEADKAFSTPSAVEGTKKMFAELKNNANDAAKVIKKDVKGATDDLDDSLKKLAESIKDITGDWKTQLETMGMTSREAELYKLKQEGATDAQLKGLQKINDELTKKEELEKLNEEGKSLTDSLMTPLEKFKAEQEKFQKLFDAGAIDQETFNRANAKAASELGGGESTGPSKQLAGAANFGSVEAYQVIAANQATPSSNDPMVNLAKIAERELSAANKQVKLLEQIAQQSQPQQQEPLL